MSAEIREGLDLAPAQGIEELVRRVLPQDDSSLQRSSPGGGFSSNLAETAGQRYTRLVERYTRSGEGDSRNDEEILKPFKARLKEAAEKLQQKRIEASDYQYEFHHAWKTSIWHLYEPVSFDLMDPGSIVEKANRWLGRGVALHDSKERFKIHFLLGEPKRPGSEKAFASAKHLLAKMPGQPELVNEGDIDVFADSVAADIARHP
jgi:hypothetical protein